MRPPLLFSSAEVFLVSLLQAFLHIFAKPFVPFYEVLSFHCEARPPSCRPSCLTIDEGEAESFFTSLKREPGLSVRHFHLQRCLMKGAVCLHTFQESIGTLPENLTLVVEPHPVYDSHPSPRGPAPISSHSNQKAIRMSIRSNITLAIAAAPEQTQRKA